METHLPIEMIQRSIYVVRGQKVMLDSELAILYGVETQTLVRAVKRNQDRFPEDFMFRLQDQEWENLRYQIGTSSSWGGRRQSRGRSGHPGRQSVPDGIRSRG